MCPLGTGLNLAYLSEYALAVCRNFLQPSPPHIYIHEIIIGTLGLKDTALACVVDCMHGV